MSKREASMTCPYRLRIVSRGAIKRLAVLLLLFGFALLWCSCAMLNMPGTSYSGELPPLSLEQAALADELWADVEMLGSTIGQRSVFFPEGLKKAETYLEQQLAEAGYSVRKQTFTPLDRMYSDELHGKVFQTRGLPCSNLEVEIRGTEKPDEIIIIGAHYDSVDDSPAANDNGSGVAATLALARRFAALQHERPLARTVRFVMFVNEEPPFFQTPDMGSWVYAKACRKRNENIIGMVSLETIGYYSDVPDSQSYPIVPIGWFYPDRGDFIAFVGNYGSRELVREVAASFRKHAQFPSQGAALPSSITGWGGPTIGHSGRRDIPQ